ncbi:MAG: sugar ABC transporter permease [Chloroflexi bacterium]|nr:sugar ABC transporter permease [Chloroflexota bacterium]
MSESASAIPITAQSSAKTRKRIKFDWIAYIYLFPALLILTVFHILPVGYAFWISMQGGRIRTFRFIGLDNYINALQAPEFWGAMQNTVFYVLGTVPITLALGLLVAYLLFQKIQGRGIYRAIYFMPHIISAVASAIVWAWVFNPTGGVANRLLELFGLPVQQWLLESDGVFKLIGAYFGMQLPSWAQGPSLALVSVMIFALWQALGFDVIIFLAGLTNINSELYEAGKIDGANGWQLFRYITIPLLAPTIFFLLVISVIGSFQAFNHIYTMNIAASQPLGGPLGTTRTVSIYMFDQLYSQNRAGYATSVAVLLSLIIFILTMIQFKFEPGRRGGGE